MEYHQKGKQSKEFSTQAPQAPVSSKPEAIPNQVRQSAGFFRRFPLIHRMATRETGKLTTVIPVKAQGSSVPKLPLLVGVKSTKNVEDRREDMQEESQRITEHQLYELKQTEGYKKYQNFIVMSEKMEKSCKVLSPAMKEFQNQFIATLEDGEEKKRMNDLIVNLLETPGDESIESMYHTTELNISASDQIINCLVDQMVFFNKADSETRKKKIPVLFGIHTELSKLQDVSTAPAAPVLPAVSPAPSEVQLRE